MWSCGLWSWIDALAEYSYALALCCATVAVNTENADEKSIMLYLSQLYRFFYEQRGSRVQAKRVARVLEELLHVLHDAADFEMRASDLIRCACPPPPIVASA